jgi:hypothetical protein
MSHESLIQNLEKACVIAAKYEGGYSGEFLDAKDFAKALSVAVTKFKGGDQTVLNELWGYFAPTTEWDDLVGEEGIDLGNSIFEVLNQMKRS